MRIVHVVTPGVVGGLESVVHALALGHGNRGHDVHVVAIVPEAGHRFGSALRGSGVELHVVVLPARAYWREHHAVAVLCRRLAPDVVHTHGYRADVLAAPAARGLGLATVTTVHGFTGGGAKNRFYERLQRWSFRRFNAVVAVSRSLAQQLRADGVPGLRLHVVPNAWHEPGTPLAREEARRALQGKEGECLIGWVGRLGAEKGPDLLLEALARLRDLPVVASVLGTGRELTVLRRSALRAGVADRVRWHGIVPDAWRLFSGFDVFALTSRTEGTPIVLFEAMAAGVPIVATRVGGVPDMVSEAEALLVSPEDSAALAEAIREVATRPEAAGCRAAAARRRLEREFALEPWLERYETIYAQAAAQVSKA